MTFSFGVYKWQRVVMVRFVRASYGDPDPDMPDIDDRGYTGDDHGPIISLGPEEKNEVTVRLVRERIAFDAPLEVRMLNPSVATVVSPAGGKLANSEKMDITIRGVKGGNPSATKLQVIWGGSTVIHELSVWVWEVLRLAVTPHLVTIGDAANPTGIASSADVDEIASRVIDIWRACGVQVRFQPTQTFTVQLGTAGILSDSPSFAEFNTIAQAKWVPQTVNVYFVHQIGTKNILGYGIAPSWRRSFGLDKPMIIAGDTSATGGGNDLTSWSNNVAHEIGHFCTLQHVGNSQVPDEREDTWARRELMHNFNLMRGHNPWPARTGDGRPFSKRPLRDDVGYGAFRRGALITMKKLTQIGDDGECSTARTQISTLGVYSTG